MRALGSLSCLVMVGGAGSLELRAGMGDLRSERELDSGNCRTVPKGAKDAGVSGSMEIVIGIELEGRRWSSLAIVGTL